MFRELTRFLLDRRLLQLTAAVALGLAYLLTVNALVDAVLMVIAQHTEPNTFGIGGPLSFGIGDTVVFYGETVSWATTFVVVAATLLLVLRLSPRGERA